MGEELADHGGSGGGAAAARGAGARSTGACGRRWMGAGLLCVTCDGTRGAGRRGEQRRRECAAAWGETAEGYPLATRQVNVGNVDEAIHLCYGDCHQLAPCPCTWGQYRDAGTNACVSCNRPTPCDWPYGDPPRLQPRSQPRLQPRL